MKLDCCDDHKSTVARLDSTAATTSKTMSLDCWGDDLVDPDGLQFQPKPPSEKAINRTFDRVMAESYPPEMEKEENAK